jgi:hypothetical protein
MNTDLQKIAKNFYKTKFDIESVTHIMLEYYLYLEKIKIEEEKYCYELGYN